MKHALWYHWLKKVAFALVETPRICFPVSQPRLIMTLLVKNEEQTLEQVLRFHKAQGVDAFIVTDNNSTDHTPDIIERFRRAGWIVAHIRETGQDYRQKRWVDRMVWMAKRQFHADWVINADADEFWYSPTGSLKTEMAQARGNVLAAEVRNVLPEEGKSIWEWDKTVRYVPEPERYDLSLYSTFGKMYKKVCHRTAGYLQIAMGNHKVTMWPKWEQRSGIIIYHYQIRTRQQFVEKMVNGGRQLENNPSRHGGRHWRYYYTIYKEGRLEEEYDRVVGTKVREALAADGYILQDNKVPTLLAALGDEAGQHHP